jgi:metallo-beta-lactamase class B
MKTLPSLVLFGLLWLASCAISKQSLDYDSPTLHIHAVTPKTLVHVSYLNTNQWGKVPCNGMIYYNNQEAVVFDTPSNDSASIQLITWVETQLKAKVKAVVINHFHADCLGGLNAFHQRGIPSYANQLTIDLAKANNLPVPQHGFIQVQNLSIGGSVVENRFLGEGHSKDNIVSYIPSEQVLFGGCMIKESNAGKGNLADANVGDWPQTVAKVKAQYPDAKFIIPGHGKSGGKELLDYTMELFKPITE